MTILRNYPRAALVAVSIVILLAGFRLVRQITRSPHSEYIAVHYSDISLQALKVTDYLPAGSKVVTLVFDGELKITSDDKFRRVYRELEKMGRSVLHEDRLVFDEENGWNKFAVGFPYREYLRVAHEYPEADAILSFCGMPYFSGPKGELPASLPELLLTRLKGGDPGRLVEQGWVKAAVLRSAPDDDSPSGYSYEVIGRE